MIWGVSRTHTYIWWFGQVSFKVKQVRDTINYPALLTESRTSFWKDQVVASSIDCAEFRVWVTNWNMLQIISSPSHKNGYCDFIEFLNVLGLLYLDILDLKHRSSGTLDLWSILDIGTWIHLHDSFVHTIHHFGMDLSHMGLNEEEGTIHIIYQFIPAHT